MGIKLPFSYETLIVAKKSVDSSGPMEIHISDDDMSDDEDDDEDEEKEDSGPKKDYFARIPQRLSANGCAFVRSTLKGNARGARFMMQRFEELKEKVVQQGKGSNKESKDNLQNYPRRRRFCSMIDRRGDDEKEDALYMFEPPDAYEMPQNHVVDWHFNAGKTCLVPSMTYSTSDNPDMDVQDTIKVDNGYNGQTLTLSFHVDSAQSVRCYLFWNMTYIRIVYPEDLRTVLCSIFDTSMELNRAFLKDAKSKEQMNGLKLSDPKFDTFYKEVKVKQKQQR